MKICHVITRMIVGGAQENTLYTCQGHLAAGDEVTLVTGPSPGPEGKLLETGIPAGLKVVVIPELVREISPWKDWRAYRKLRQLFRQERFDVVHTHASKAGVLGRAAAWAEKIPFVVHTVHGNAFGRYTGALKNFLYTHLERWAGRRCHRIYAVAQAMIEQCVEAKIAPREKYQVVYSGMDLSSFVEAQPSAALREQLGIPADAPVVGVIARLFHLKGHDVLIEAAPQILQHFPTCCFLFVGSGILREQFEARIRELGMEKNFVFAGLVPPKEVCRYTALMTLVAHLSLREGLPRAAVQGLAAGKPVVAYPLDGTPEVVLPGETGLLGTPEDVTQVAKNICCLLENPMLCQQMGERGQQLVLKKFDWHRMADILREEYLRGVGENREKKV